MADLSVAEWKAIPGFKEYEASTNGDVFSYKSNLILKKARTKNGYYKITLHENGMCRQEYVHRIIALTFLANVGLREVNHIDGNKANNMVSNLEWVSSSKNKIHAYKNGLMTPTKNKRRTSKKLMQTDIAGNVVACFSTQEEAALATGVQRQNISKVITGKRNHAGGYRWKYKELSNE